VCASEAIGASSILRLMRSAVDVRTLKVLFIIRGKAICFYEFLIKPEESQHGRNADIARSLGTSSQARSRMERETWACQLTKDSLLSSSAHLKGKNLM
jgi:hypothetical protein